MSSTHVSFAVPKVNDRCTNGNALMSEKSNGLPPKSMSARDVEMVRLIGQYLCDKGYSTSYIQLAKDSGITLEPQAATDLRSAILAGKWEDAEKAVKELAPIIDNPASLAEIHFLLLEQQFLELAEADDAMAALMLLRSRITPLQRNAERLAVLTRCLMCRTPEEVRAEAGGWSGAHGGSRSVLVDNIQRYVPAQTMLPPTRLETLITEAVRAQLNACTFHNQHIVWPDALNSISLLQPHSCSIQEFPVFPVQTIDHRDTDLWFCQFSPDGTHLATGGKDANVDVWRVDVQTHTIISSRTLSTSSSYIGHLCWSPNSKKLAVCCGELHGPVIVFDVANRRQLCSQQVNDEDVYCSAAFFADSRKLAFGGMKGAFYVMDTEDDGHILVTVEGYRVQSMVALLTPPPVDITPSLASFTDNSVHDLEAYRFTLDPTTPGAPAAAVASGHSDSVSMTDLTHHSVEVIGHGPPFSGIDQLLVADSLHRVRLFKFGYTTSAAVASRELEDLNPLIQIASVATTTTTTTATQSTASWAPPPSSSLAVSVAGSRGNRSTIQLPLSSVAAVMQAAGALISSSSAVVAAAAVSSAPGAPPTTASRPATSSASAGSLLAFRQTTSDSGLGRQHQLLHASSSPGSALGSSAGIPASATSTTAAVAAASTATLSPSVLVANLLQSYPRLSLFPESSASASASAVATDGTSRVGGGGLLDASTQAVTQGSTESTTTGTTTTSFAATAAAGVTTDVTAARNTNQTYGLLQHCTLIKELHAIQSITLSSSGRKLLVTVHKRGLHLWDLESLGMLQQFAGFKQDIYKLTSTIGGINEDFVASGSEDGFLHLWHLSSGARPIYSSMAATGEHPVTCASWNPALPTMLATVNDEGEIRIWAPAKYVTGCG
uniref:WD repeat-containing protein 26 n=1 Tax=Schistocephalus solidus TaxID=70667 RepID=A0A0X3P273_SCHSO